MNTIIVILCIIVFFCFFGVKLTIHHKEEITVEDSEKMYTEEEVIAFTKWMYDYKADINKVEELFKQFKNK
jgi:hypothetical protein